MAAMTVNNVQCAVEIDNQLRLLNVQQLREERARIDQELRELKEQVGDLAFNNYGTYADAGRTTQDCAKIFTDMHTQLDSVLDELPVLTDEIKQFFGKAGKLSEEAALLRTAAEPSCHLWELIRLPKSLEANIRYGNYDDAYSLTNYGIMLQQHSIGRNALIQRVSERLIEARSYLLEELFNKFAGPQDLAAAIQTVNNVRKIPFLTGAQLRVSVLQYRDVYLEKQILDITGHPEFALKAIDVYKECMYESIVLYTAVFPENEIAKKDPSVDPRWEPWPPCTPSTILSDWAGRNIRRLFEIVERAEMKSAVDMSAVWSSLMSFFASFGRLGLDFRPLVVERLKALVLQRFSVAVREATTRFHATRSLTVVVAGFSANPSASGDPSLTLADFASTKFLAPMPPAELSAWDDVCVYGNSLLDALNGLKYSLSPVMLSTVVDSLRASLTSSLSWLVETFGGTQSAPAAAHFARSVRLLGVDLVHFLNRCLLYFFPYETFSRLYGSAISKQYYMAFIDLNIRAMLHESAYKEKLEEVLLPVLTRPKLAELDIDAVLTRKPLEDTVAAEGTENGAVEESAEKKRTDDGGEDIAEKEEPVASSVSTAAESTTATAVVSLESTASPEAAVPDTVEVGAGNLPSDANADGAVGAAIERAEEMDTVIEREAEGVLKREEETKGEEEERKDEQKEAWGWGEEEEGADGEEQDWEDQQETSAAVIETASIQPEKAVKGGKDD